MPPVSSCWLRLTREVVSSPTCSVTFSHAVEIVDVPTSASVLFLRFPCLFVLLFASLWKDARYFVSFVSFFRKSPGLAPASAEALVLLPAVLKDNYSCVDRRFVRHLVLFERGGGVPVTHCCDMILLDRGNSCRRVRESGCCTLTFLFASQWERPHREKGPRYFLCNFLHVVTLFVCLLLAVLVQGSCPKEQCLRTENTHRMIAFLP